MGLGSNTRGVRSDGLANLAIHLDFVDQPGDPLGRRKPETIANLGQINTTVILEGALR